VSADNIDIIDLIAAISSYPHIYPPQRVIREATEFGEAIDRAVRLYPNYGRCL
jgi:hypothetical protein